MSSELAGWLRPQRQSRGWPVAEMARRLRRAARDGGDHTMPGANALCRNIRRWENGNGMQRLLRRADRDIDGSAALIAGTRHSLFPPLGGTSNEAAGFASCYRPYRRSPFAGLGRWAPARAASVGVCLPGERDRPSPRSPRLRKSGSSSATCALTSLERSCYV